MDLTMTKYTLEKKEHALSQMNAPQTSLWPKWHSSPVCRNPRCAQAGA
jgi:hypothetical protein